MSQLTREAREGIMRAWLEILRERHPGVSWIPADDLDRQGDSTETAVESDEVAGVLAVQ